MLKALWKWIKRLRHRHVWVDWFDFDSCYEMSIPSGQTRVVARAMMQRCECGATQRRPLAQP